MDGSALSHKTITYLVDRSNRIEAIEGDWSGFASENDGQAIADPGSVVGKQIFGFFGGSEVVSFYRQVFDQVRLTSGPAEIPFRCDAPELCRHMRLVISRRPFAGLRIDSVTVAVEDRPAFDALRVDAPRSQEAAHICSVCRRVHVADKGWMEPADAASQTTMFLDAAHPNLEERVCEDCAEIAQGCKFIVTEPPENTSKLPTVLYLHGHSQGERLLRMFAPPRLSSVSPGNEYRLISPILRKGQMWRTEQIEEILCEVLQNYRVDLSRLSVTGVSIGALAGWNWALNSSLPVAAVAPISGNLVAPTSPETLARLEDLPIWAFYGDRDPTLSRRIIQNWFDRVHQANPDAKMTIFDDNDHDAWSRAYADDSFWDWLLGSRFTIPDAYA